PIDLLVVDHEETAVGRELDVELDEIGAALERLREGSERVLRRLERRAAVPADERPPRRRLHAADERKQGALEGRQARQVYQQMRTARGGLSARLAPSFRPAPSRSGWLTRP